VNVAPDRVRRVLVVAFHFPPSLEVGAHACRQLTRHLPDWGWEPVVLTVHERFYSNVESGARYDFPGTVVRTRSFRHPLEVWAAVRRVVAGRRRDVVISDNAIRGTKRSGGTLRRWLLSLLHLPDAQIVWLPIAVVVGLQTVRRYGIQHVFSSGPDWTNHLVGLCIALVTGRRWTAHFRDPWIGIPQWKPVSKLSLAVEAALEALVLRRAATVVCVTERHRQMLLERYATLSPAKVVTIPNGFDETEWSTLPREEQASNHETFVIAYVGSIYQARDPSPLFKAVRRLVDEGSVAEKDLSIDLIGSCDFAAGADLRHIAHKAGLERIVHFTGALPRRVALARMRRADLLLLLAEDQPYQIPGKTYEYLRAGRPILALTRPGAVADLLRGVVGTAVIDPSDGDAITAELRRHLSSWRRAEVAESPDPSFVAHFDRSGLARDLAAVLAGVTPRAATIEGLIAMERR
jgi:glycosyltransferase involved in cell wall biosynthesis